MPRRHSHASQGPGTAPVAMRRKPTSSASASSSTTTMPPMMSEWPFRYLVVEWTTMSAPNARGRWLKGEAKVLSTATSAPPSWATSAMAAMSHRRIIGLDGVSRWTSFVRSVMAARTASGSRVSTNVKSRPSLANTRVNMRMVPP